MISASGGQQDSTEHAQMFSALCGSCLIERVRTQGTPWLVFEVRPEGGVDLGQMTEHCEHVDEHEDDSEKKKKKKKELKLIIETQFKYDTIIIII